MIYELRTYDLHPHAVPEAEKRITASHERGNLRELVACFHSEIGPLNQVTQILEHDGSDEIAGNSRNVDHDLDDLVVSVSSELFTPFAISPRIEPANIGPFFEIRKYVYQAGELPKVIAAWEAALPARLPLGPLAAIWHSTDESRNTLVHIWPYASLDARMEIRRKARETGLWPPLAYCRRNGLPEYKLIRMENRIVMASEVSPLR
jgi:hypothetical protein